MVPRAQAAFAPDGSLADPKIRAGLAAYLEGFAGFVRASA
jgi:hypothetical protein